MTAEFCVSRAEGTVTVPPSKSMSHRLLMAAGLSNGISTIKNIALSDDVLATIDALEAFGAEVTVCGDAITVKGANLIKIPQKAIDCRESGSTMRFFLPIGLLYDKPVTFTGRGRLPQRPMTVYEDICADQGLLFERNENGITVKGRLSGGIYKVRGDISSQFITGLLFALPLLESDSVIEILPPVESRPYIDMTLKTLADFGITFFRDGDRITVPGKQKYQPRELTVEGDYSNAAFIDAFNLVGGSVVAEGLDENSIQGDKVYKKHFEMLKNGENSVIDISQCPDLGPVLMALAAVNGGVRLVGTRRLSMKESDRGSAMADELKKFGIDTVVGENEIIVFPGKLRKPEMHISSHNDHRIAMSMAVLLSVTGGMLENAECVNKSYPAFWEDLKKLGIIVNVC